MRRRSLLPAAPVRSWWEYAYSARATACHWNNNSALLCIYSSFKYLVGFDVWALKICQETLMTVIAIRLKKDKISGRTDTLDSGAITENRRLVRNQDKGSPKSSANPMAYTNSLLMRKRILPFLGPAPSRRRFSSIFLPRSG